MTEHTIRVPNVDGDATAIVTALGASESPAAARIDARIDTATDTVRIEARDTAAVEWAYDWLESTRHHARRRGADADAQAAATIANAICDVLDERAIADGGVPQTAADASAWTPGAPQCQCGVALTEFTSRVQARRIARVYGDADGVVPACPACVETRTGAPGITRVTVAIKKETDQITGVGR